MEIGRKGKPLVFAVEKEAFEGVRRVAGKVALDVEKVTGLRPDVRTPGELSGAGAGESFQVVLCATVGKSPLLEKLSGQGLVDLGQVEGRREVFALRLLKNVPGVGEEVLLICGSDKRGTIYGMFTFSEYIGVSPLCFWGDAEPAKRDRILIGGDIETVSREPSVRYRGFFINDEWPCFGNWTNSHFGGFNAQAYDRVFELLLRLKGNYLWPAMWSASFPLDGPGSQNEELADLYGVVMGYSHHEPCLRASEEWDKVRGPESPYGNEWNFYTNEKGLLRYWEDALKRSGKYENLITIGMRGERDTSMLGEKATVAENVALLKDIIRKQRDLIRRCVNPDLEKVPQLLALYKEVEAYFYGDDQVPGLKDWEELDGVICMLCEDNFGHMRTLPTEEIRRRKGGFGMYYHFDYHGGPVSYEWVDSTPLSLTWEQMCMAYEYGIRDAWIVNVGDLKFHEVPLSYFLNLAYDYDRWGASNKDSCREYTAFWAAQNFPLADSRLQADICRVLSDYIDINHQRRPESLHAEVYHPCHYEETERMLQRAMELEELSCQVLERLPESEKDAYYSMVHFSAMASMNLLKMHLYAGKNHHYAAQGRTAANLCAAAARDCIRRDREYAREMGEFRQGKWNGMQMAQHIGFTKWNEDDCRYPVLHEIEPAYKPRMKVSRRDSRFVATKNYGAPMTVPVRDFLYEGVEKVVLEIANDGVGRIRYKIEPADGQPLPPWLQISPLSGETQYLEEVTLTCRRDLLPAGPQTLTLHIRDEETCVAVEICAAKNDIDSLPPMTFLPRDGVTVMAAEHFCCKKDTPRGAYTLLPGYGKYGSALKVLPSTAAFTPREEKPSLTYAFCLDRPGDYTVEIRTAPTNTVANRQPVTLLLDNHLGQTCQAQLIPPDYRAGENSDPRWTGPVLDQERRTQVTLPFAQGLQHLTIEAQEPGVVLERILIYRPEDAPLPAYLGPQETYYKPRP